MRLSHRCPIRPRTCEGKRSRIFSVLASPSPSPCVPKELLADQDTAIYWCVFTLNVIDSVKVGLCEGNHGNHPRAVRAHWRPAASPARQRQPRQHGGTERDPVRDGTRVQVARPAGTLRQLAHHLHPHEPVVEQGCARPGIRGTATRGIVRIRVEAASLDSTGGEGASGRDGCPEKNGAQAIGKSRGGWTSKIHMVAARTAIGFSLSPGQAGDAPERRNLLSRLPVPAEYLVMDQAYEGDKTRQCLVRWAA